MLASILLGADKSILEDSFSKSSFEVPEAALFCSKLCSTDSCFTWDSDDPWLGTEFRGNDELFWKCEVAPPWTLLGSFTEAGLSNLGIVIMFVVDWGGTPRPVDPTAWLSATFLIWESWRCGLNEEPETLVLGPGNEWKLPELVYIGNELGGRCIWLCWGWFVNPCTGTELPVDGGSWLRWTIPRGSDSDFLLLISAIKEIESGKSLVHEKHRSFMILAKVKVRMH